MKTEIEARLLDVDVKEFVKKLRENKAVFIGDWIQSRYCYDFNPVKPNSWIRLRTNGKQTTLTIKEINNSKIDGTKELEVEVSDFYETDAILNKLGYKARSKQENRRVRFVLDNVEIDIDFWPLIPPYVEFEAESEEQIKSVCDKLGVDFSNLITFGVEDVYRKYGIELKKIETIILEEKNKNIVFEVE